MPADYNIPMTDAQITEALQLMVERVSEGWAQETYDGSPVGSGSPYYHKSSKWWATQAADAAARAEAAVPAGTAGAVFFDRVQTLTEGQKAQARENIGTDKPSENKSASGDIVSFADGSATPVKDLKATLDVVQPVEYGHPYPAGGSRNIFGNLGGTPTADGTYNGIVFKKNADGSYSFNGTATASTWLNIGTFTLPTGTYTASFKIDGTYSGTVAFGANGGAFVQYPSITEYPRTKTGSAETTDMYSFNIANGTQVNNLKIWVQIEQGSTASDFVPYANVCPIYPVTEVEVSRAGKNLLDEAHLKNGIIGVGGVVNQNQPYYRYGRVIVKPNTTYTLSYSQNRSGFIYATYNKVGQWLETVSAPSTRASFTFTTPSDVYFIAVNTNSNYAWTQLEKGSTATPYEAYKGQTYTIELNGEYYGGELDVTTGVLTVDKAMVDLGSMAWGYDSGRGQFRVTVADKADTVRNVTNYICSTYPSNAPVGGYGDATYGLQACYATSAVKAFIVVDTAYTDANTFKTAMSGQQLVYELASPLTIQLTPTEVQTLTGTNNLWADSGAVNVSYWTEGLVEADNILDIIKAESFATKSMMAHPNLLDNGWFFVNQRGQSSYTGAGYSVDRWQSGNANQSVVVDANGITINADTSFGFQQKLSAELITFLVGKTVTYSILLQNGVLRTKTFTWPNSSNTLIGVINNIGTLYAGSTLGVSLVHPSALSIRAIKLELGSVSTLANDAPPNYAEELARCQRYFIAITASNNWHPMGFGLATNGTTAYISLPIPVAMRTGTITVTVPNITNLNLTGGGSINIALTSIAYRAISENAVSLTITTSGLTQGEAYVLYSKAASTTIQISADL